MTEKVIPKIRTFLFAEDIRQEKSNKYIVAGIFNSVVMVSDLPARIPVAFYMEFFPVPEGPLDISIKISGPGEDSVVINVKAEIHDPSRPLVVPSPRLEIALECEGTLIVEIQFDDGEYQEADRVQIKRDPTIVPEFYPIAEMPPVEQSRSDDQQ